LYPIGVILGVPPVSRPPTACVPSAMVDEVVMVKGAETAPTAVTVMWTSMTAPDAPENAKNWSEGLSAMFCHMPWYVSGLGRQTTGWSTVIPVGKSEFFALSFDKACSAPVVIEGTSQSTELPAAGQMVTLLSRKELITHVIVVLATVQIQPPQAPRVLRVIATEDALATAYLRTTS